MQLIESHRISRRQLWWRRGLLLALALLGVGAWFGYRPAVNYYKRSKQQRALAQAREFIAQRDAPNAQLALEVALTAGPGNLDIMRTAAAMLEQVNAPQAMRLRRTVARSRPDSVEDAAALVFCCLRFRDVNAAKDALSAFSPAFANHPTALRAALAFAVHTDDVPVIDFIYSQLKAHFPNDDDLVISQALLHLKHPQPETRTAARRTLESLAATKPLQALRIHRELAGFALATRDYTEARTRFARVIAHPEATLGDRLQLANLDVLVAKQPFEQVFTPLAATAGRNETDAAQFVQWLLVQRRATEADRWLATLPKATREHRALRSLEADIAAQLQDWDRFAALLGTGAWGPISKETLRLVGAAQAISDRDRPALRRETWDLALQSAGGHLGTLSALQRIASTWRWETEIERTLWSIVRGFPDQTWAHQTLFDHYAAKKDTVAMRDVMNGLHQTDASVPRYSHDWALLTLLTNPSAGPTAAKEIMEKLYAAAPTNPNYATGHAFALAQSRKPAEALAVLQKLSALERDYPPRQPYLAFISGVARDAAGVERAEKFAQGVTYLPEEKRLFERAREELERKPPRPAGPKQSDVSKN